MKQQHVLAMSRKSGERSAHVAVTVVPGNGDFLICTMCSNCSDSCNGQNNSSEKYWEEHGSHLYSAETMHYLFHFGD